MIQESDNFLNEKDFKNIKNTMESNNFPWFFSNGVNLENDGHFQFNHIFYKTENFGFINSNYFDLITPLIEKINPRILIRIKSNLLLKTKNIKEFSFHKDYYDEGAIAAVFYINSNNGYTGFDNGKKIISKENKIIFFPANENHFGSTCTDSDRRILINIVFFPN